MMDINTVSAGGGTIARVDRLGALEVGPQSAGAVPGPGLLRPRRHRADHHRLQPGARPAQRGQFPRRAACGSTSARRAQAVERVAKPLGMSVEDAAEGIIRIIDVKMEEAIKAISTMRGHDLRDFMLLAFGGAGPLHAGRIARDLGMAGIVVPLYPGVYSAIGLLMSDVKHDYVQSRMTPMSRARRPTTSTRCSRGCRRRPSATCATTALPPTSIRVERALDLRYAGQGYEMTLPCPAGAMTAAGLAELRADVRRAAPHACSAMPRRRSRSRWCPTGCAGSASFRRCELPRFKRAGPALADARRATRRVRFDGATIDCPVYQREKLDVGLTVAGPAVLDQFDCTTVLCPGQVARVDEWKNLIVTMENDDANLRRRSRSGESLALRHRAGDAELAVPHRLLHHHPRIAGRLLRADEHPRRDHRPARRAAAAHRRVPGLHRRRASRTYDRRDRRGRRLHHQPSLPGRQPARARTCAC